MGTVFKLVLKRLFRNIHMLVWSVGFPIAMLIGIGLYVGNPDYNLRLLAGVLTTSILFGALNVTAIDVLQQRNRGVYKLLKAAPFTVTSFITVLTSARTVVQIVVIIATTVTGMLFFNISLDAMQLLSLLLVMIVGTLCLVCLGFFISNFAKDEGQINMMTNLSGMPMIFASEAFYSLANAPEWVQFISTLLPFTYFVRSTSAVISNDLNNFSTPLLILSGFMLLFLTLAVLTFRWDSEAKVTLRFKKA